MKNLTFCGRCIKVSPVFIYGVKLCRFKRVQIQICRPFGRKFQPFPTTFWLTCPYLVKRAGMIESSGGIHELENYIISRGLIHEWRKYNFLHQIIRLELAGKIADFMRRYRTKIFRDVIRGGIGGIKNTDSVNIKCLHLQTASFLGLGFHPAGEWLKVNGLYGDCKKGLCLYS